MIESNAFIFPCIVDARFWIFDEVVRKIVGECELIVGRSAIKKRVAHDGGGLGTLGGQSRRIGGDDVGR